MSTRLPTVKSILASKLFHYCPILNFMWVGRLVCLVLYNREVLSIYDCPAYYSPLMVQTTLHTATATSHYLANMETDNCQNCTNNPDDIHDGGPGVSMGLVIGGALGTFFILIIAFSVCYAKRWLCFAVRNYLLWMLIKPMNEHNVLIDYFPWLQCRGDVPDDFNEMSGPRVAEAYRNDKLHGRWRVFQWDKKDEQL